MNITKINCWGKNYSEEIVDIYNLDNIIVNNKCLRVKIFIEKKKCVQIEINDELIDFQSHIIESDNCILLRLCEILSKYNMSDANKITLMKFKLHNINVNKDNLYIQFSKNGNLFGKIDRAVDIFNEQIIATGCDEMEILLNRTQIQAGNIEIITRQIDSGKLDESDKLIGVGDKYNIYSSLSKTECIPRDNSIIVPIGNNMIMGDSFDMMYIAPGHLVYFEIPCGAVSHSNETEQIKTIKLPATIHNGKYKLDVTVVLERHKPTLFYYYLVSQIIYNNECINMFQKTPCNCVEYKIHNYMKSKSNLHNKLKMCMCFIRQKTSQINTLTSSEKSTLSNYEFNIDIFCEKMNIREIPLVVAYYM